MIIVIKVVSSTLQIKVDTEGSAEGAAIAYFCKQIWIIKDEKEAISFKIKTIFFPQISALKILLLVITSLVFLMFFLILCFFFSKKYTHFLSNSL